MSTTEELQEGICKVLSDNYPRFNVKENVPACNDKIDISDITMKKIKAKLRRWARALERWKRAKNATNEQAARAYIRAANRMLFKNPSNTELTWCRWYFSLISTDKSLKELDLYTQMCISYVCFGNHGKKTYNFKYGEIKHLGYQNLVYWYYAYKNGAPLGIQQ